MHAWVLGMGRSGSAASHLLCANGYRVSLLDEGKGSLDPSEIDRLRASGVAVLSHQANVPEDTVDLVVVSPGLADTHPWVQQARGRCVDVISELELGYRYSRTPILAVTGTNGKSTLTRLVHEMLEAAGYASAAGGNLGVPLCELVLSCGSCDWFVVEVSSFQLELVGRFHPRGAVFLNLQPDHLDRHGDMENYFAIKSRLFENMVESDYAVVHADLLESVRAFLARRSPAGLEYPRFIAFGGDSGEWHYDASKSEIYGAYGGKPMVFAVGGTYFDNPVTGATACAAAALVTHVCGVESTAIQAALSAFRPLGHRTEVVGEFDEILYIDDSKATNLAAMCAALSMQKRPVRLIAGGLLKENDILWTKEVLKKHVLCAYLIGSSADLFAKGWCDTVEVEVCGTLKNAMELVFRDVHAGEVVLLSPGCASFDQFRSYAERGAIFAELVRDRYKVMTRS